MKQKDYRRLEMEQSGMQVILEFPSESENEENVKKEVKEILACVLQEYFTKTFLAETGS